MADVIKLPPKSEEAELSVLGAILIDNEAVLSVSEFLRPEHFYDSNRAGVYEAMLSLYENRMPIDIVTVSEKLKELKILKKIGGKAYLARLADGVPTAANVESYGRIIKSLSAKRELISSAARITEKAFDEAMTAEILMDVAEQEIFALTQRHIRNAPTSLKDVLTASFDRLDELQKMGSGLRGVPTGFGSLDRNLAGMQDSNLLILAARPGVGKTALGLNIARYVAVEAKLPTCFFSLEMSKEELVDRLLVRQGLIDAWKLKTGQLNEDDFNSLSESMGILAEAPLYIDDTPGMTVTEVRTKARRLQLEKGIKFVVVDYLQLMHGVTRDNRVQEVSEISQGLKNLARELKIPILALAQLSRAMETRGGRPRLSDLRESGSIEQDADVVMFLYREDEDIRESVTCSIEKHRNGPTGSFNLYFNGKQVSLECRRTESNRHGL
ncbi:MAG: Replicative DNA helicase [Candidatus Shapirobacteria bacterium GW2011_GWE2_38_30]|uniref:Replicative DNA helicase n=1 Tax=Candidatus Shapirobacteria bacterium GW2011_GWE2_38_30 TaxID=1618490 RepID=A0A0G0M755_9BACT|nr:MAG: Replicative DNA helicase [Candidatus Shapirobacteria bacterium GW2011_GWE2_38_30]